MDLGEARAPGEAGSVGRRLATGWGRDEVRGHHDDRHPRPPGRPAGQAESPGSERIGAEQTGEGAGPAPDAPLQSADRKPFAPSLRPGAFLGPVRSTGPDGQVDFSRGGLSPDRRLFGNPTPSHGHPPPRSIPTPRAERTQAPAQNKANGNLERFCGPTVGAKRSHAPAPNEAKLGRKTNPTVICIGFAGRRPAPNEATLRRETNLTVICTGFAGRWPAPNEATLGRETKPMVIWSDCAGELPPRRTRRPA
jgi:hypothetical protein